MGRMRSQCNVIPVLIRDVMLSASWHADAQYTSGARDHYPMGIMSLQYQMNPDFNSGVFVAIILLFSSWSGVEARKTTAGYLVFSVTFLSPIAPFKPAGGWRGLLETLKYVCSLQVFSLVWLQQPKSLPICWSQWPLSFPASSVNVLCLCNFPLFTVKVLLGANLWKVSTWCFCPLLLLSTTLFLPHLVENMQSTFLMIHQ